MNTNRRTSSPGPRAVQRETNPWPPKSQPPYSEPLAGCPLPLDEGRFWTGDWRLGMAEERVALAEKRVALAEQQLALAMERRARPGSSRRQ